MKKIPNGRKEIRGISNVEEDRANEEERGLVRGVWGEGVFILISKRVC